MSDIPTANTYDGRQWVPAEDYMATFGKLCDARKRVAELEIDGHVATENLRDTFAAAALTGLLASETNGALCDDLRAKLAYAAADAMLRERASTNSPEISSTLTIHDAVPAARATDGSIGTDTPEPQRTPGQCSKPREGTSEVAWAVEAGGELEASFCGPAGREDAADWAEQSNGKIVPLYRKPQPTLTDAERDFLQNLRGAYEELANQTGYVNAAAQKEAREHAATLRGLLERLK